MNNINSITQESVVPRQLTPKKLFLSKLKRRLLHHVWLARIGLLLLIAGGTFLVFTVCGFLLKNSKLAFYSGLARNFLFTPRNTVRVIDNKINILVMGKGGGIHESPDLTDTMILASISLYSNKITLLNLPRDIWIPDLRTKLNSIYYWGNQKREGGGKVLAKSVVEEITGVPIQYSLVVDFDGFTKFINLIGGIEVDVENFFTDEKFPIAGKEDDECNGDEELKCRYETITFSKGKVRMDGATALKFVRSRNAIGDEGTDFARGKRQERVIQAIVKKVLSKNILLKPKKLLELEREVVKYIETDITPNEEAFIVRKIVSGRKNISTLPFPEDLLVNPPKLSKYDNLYVLIPKGEGWSEIQSWISCKLDGVGCK